MKKRQLYVIICLLLIFVFFFYASFIVEISGINNTAIATKTIDARRIADVNKPGTVMIQTTYSTVITVPESKINEANFEILVSYISSLIKYGLISNTEEAILEEFIKEMYESPLDYLIPSSKTITKEVQMGGMGTGFIVTPDGYIITNAHVVYMPEEQLKHQLVMMGLEELIMQDAQDFIDQIQSSSFQATDEIIEKLMYVVFEYYYTYLQTTEIEKHIYTTMGVAVPGLQTIQKGYTSDVRIIGEPAPGKDVAILKIDKNNLPTVKLGNDSEIRTGDPIYVLGYPAVATFNPYLDAESISEASLTSGLVSARKTMPGGWDILQIDASISHGNSGGPVFNSKGEVIGIATFGSPDFTQGTLVQGMNFAVPISIAKQYLNEINVQPQESHLSRVYREGLELFGENKYKLALSKFREVDELNPGHPYAKDYISRTRAAIEDGLDKSSSSGNYLKIIGIIFLILILILILFLISRKLSFKIEKRDKKINTFDTKQ